jgi:hypothetical protein
MNHSTDVDQLISNFKTKHLWLKIRKQLLIFQDDHISGLKTLHVTA